MTIDRASVEKLAANIADMRRLEDERTATIAKMVRACISRLKSPKIADRTEAIKGLSDLADTLEGRNQI